MTVVAPPPRSKGGRPANPTPKWSPERHVWTVRVTTRVNGPQEARDLPNIREDQPEVAKAVAKVVSDRVRRGEGEGASHPETVKSWVEGWIKDRKLRGIVSAQQDKGRVTNHVLPTLGSLAMADVTRDDIERLVEVLDGKVRAGELAAKTASNVWTLVTTMFDDACRSKTRALRCRAESPTRDVRGPDAGIDRSSTYLYPSEFLKLVTAPDEKVPRQFRELYAVAVYTYARAGELEALEPGDVDLEHRIVSITKAVERDTGIVKSTKSGESRRNPIEPRLLPLLRRLKGDGKAERLLWLPNAVDRAVLLREHLLAAGVDRADLFADNARQRHIVFHDLRATGITWCAARGDDPLRLKQRAGHRGFSTTEGYIREAENLAGAFGEPFPALPVELTGGSSVEEGGFSNETPDSSTIPWSKGGSNP